MKTTKYLSAVLALLLLIAVIPASAQQERERAPKGEAPHEMMMKDKPQPPEPPKLHLPDLTKEQMESIKKLNLENEKANLPVENSINELEAKLRSVTTGDNASFDQASKLIDEITALRGKLMKNNIRTHLEVRKLLNDEQKIIFDKNPPMERGVRPDKKEMMKMKRPG